MLDQKLKKRAVHRARIIRGQMDGLIKAIGEEKYCVDLITQSRSIQLSLKSTEDKIDDTSAKQPSAKDEHKHSGSCH